MRGKFALKYLTSNVFCITPEYLEMMISVAQDGGVIDVQENQPNKLEINQNVAIINVDGAMIKRGDYFSNICGMTSYAKIQKQITTAENTDGVDTILFTVDTPGGSVSGVDNVGEQIFNSKLKTVTLYENLGASAGVWAFSASNEVYATETTELGSIGVIYATQVPKDDGSKKISIVSSNAPNKTGEITDAKYQEKIKTQLDNIESIFFNRLTRNTGLSKEALIKGFNQGDVVMASKAKEIGFLNGITTKRELLNKLIKGEQPMTATEQKTLDLLANHDSEDAKAELTALLATSGVNAVWEEKIPEASLTDRIEKEAKEAMLNSAKISALLGSTASLTEAEKIACIEEGKSFKEITKMVLEKEKGNLESLETTPSEQDQAKAEAEAMMAYAKNHKIRG